MPCPVLVSLASSVDAVGSLSVPTGLGADLVLQEQVAALAAAAAKLHTELAMRMAALERSGPAGADVRGDAVRAGLSGNVAKSLRAQGVFAAEHPAVEQAWSSGTITAEHVDAMRRGATRLGTPQLREQLVKAVLPHLPGLDARRAGRLVAHAVDVLDPGDPDSEELSEHAARRLDWSQCPGGGLLIEGYLPAAEAGAFRAAINALVESLRVQGDGHTPAQRRADALAALVAVAGRHGLPTAGGQPATLTMTVSLDEAARVALRDPAEFATPGGRRPRGGSTVGGVPAGDAAIRFGVCCAAVTPVLVEPPASGSLLDRISRTGTKPLAVGRKVRLATAAQRQALQLRDDGCAIPGCTVAAAYTEPHHVVGWALGGATDLDEMVSLCWVHHRLTELGRFTFIRRLPGDTRPAAALEHPLYWIIPPQA